MVALMMLLELVLFPEGAFTLAANEFSPALMEYFLVVLPVPYSLKGDIAVRARVGSWWALARASIACDAFLSGGGGRIRVALGPNGIAVVPRAARIGRRLRC